MNEGSERQVLEPGSKVAVIGGGPAGAFFALHLLREAERSGRQVQVVVFEKRSVGAGLATCGEGCWKGCNYCAGGLSPRLLDVLKELGLAVPEEVIQRRIDSITVQGYWKNIELDVPPGRELLSVYRGSRPSRRPDRQHGFDAFLLNAAVAAGAELVGEEVIEIAYSERRRPVVQYRSGEGTGELEADFVVVATGVNEGADGGTMVGALRRLLPEFAPPRLRRAVVFELEVEPEVPSSLASTVHFVEYGSRSLRLEMCSLVPKRGYLTVVLVGPSVDGLGERGESREVIRQFLDLPHIRRLAPANVRWHAVCACRPSLVVGSARQPFGERVAAVGDLVTTRLYKDGILSAQETARALAETVLGWGVDAESLRRGYGPTLRGFRRDNRFAAVVFVLHRVFFGSSGLSRVLYQAVITERKSRPRAERRLEQILWRISSGDDRYEEIFWAMLHPATVGSIFVGGVLITMRNYVAEVLFGLRWEGFGRFTTGVAKERLEAKRQHFARLIAESHVVAPDRPEFERMYTIKIRAPRDRILAQLGRFGEPDRGYLWPRGVRIERVAGRPNTPGCVVQYTVVSRQFRFRLELEQLVEERLAIYRVRDGFARGGVLIFEIEPLTGELSALSIYVGFNFARGTTGLSRVWAWLFRHLFPAFVHDVVWNHSLCQLRDVVERESDRGNFRD
ncbi:MAG: hypothetical protein FJ387_08100 [Verrucomicrobia bacterium]|nr:hypothetical protein [Verrucomicrobiota bacterium]